MSTALRPNPTDPFLHHEISSVSGFDKGILGKRQVSMHADDGLIFRLQTPESKSGAHIPTYSTTIVHTVNWYA